MFTPPRIPMRLAGALALTLALSACGPSAAGSADVDRSVLAATVTPPVASGTATGTDTNRLVVYKTPTCGCCKAWVDHAREAGFEIEVHDLASVDSVKEANGVPAELRSCHTARVAGYTIEGHVPATDIRRFLRERPAVAGIAVPGMPMGSPGMEGSYKDRYDVVTFGRGAPSRVYASH